MGLPHGARSSLLSLLEPSLCVSSHTASHHFYRETEVVPVDYLSVSPKTHAKMVTPTGMVIGLGSFGGN